MKIQNKILVSALIWVMGATVATAGDFARHHDRSYSGGWSFTANSGEGLPSFVPGGTYVGGISAVYQRGNGLYVSVAPGVIAAPNLRALPAPKAKIITVSDSRPNTGCSMEAGVCVIRGEK